MKIQGRKSHQLGALGPINIPAQPEPVAAEPVSVTADDQVDVSSTQQLKKLRDTIQSMPSVRAEKVGDLKGAIEGGNYFIESQKLAKKVVDDVIAEAIMKERKEKARR